MKAKSYNPFKMWGSWVGAGTPIGIFVLDWILYSIYNDIRPKWLLNYSGFMN